MSEFIGSRISLISKSDIKYIGTLHEINSDTHTVALESVTSYGTEGRKNDPSQEIPGSDQVYEYIVFRGSDVKELTIVSPPSAPKENKPPPVPNDPAILGSARPPPQNQQPPPQAQQQQFPPHPPPPFGYPNQFHNQPPPPRFGGPGGAHGFPGSPGAVPGYGGMGNWGPPPPGYNFPPPGPGFPQPSPGPFQQPNQMPIGPPGQQMNQRPPPPPQQQQPPREVPVGSKNSTPQPAPSHAPSAQQTQQKPIEMSGTPVPPGNTATAGPPPPVESKPTLAAAAAPPKPAAKTANRIAVPLPAQKPATQQQAPVDPTQAATAAVAAAMAKLGNAGGSNAQPVDNLTQQVNQMRVQEGQNRGRGARGGRGGTRGGRRDSTKVEVPKEDFDFESSNAKFNKQDLVKEAIGTGSPAPESDTPATTNGHAEAEDVVIPPKATVERGYDKKSSFFDNISSDLKDRVERESDHIDGRAMRREERTRNVETFGQGSVDGGYRGRGRGRGRGGFGRGGTRGGGGYRGDHQPRGGGYHGRGAAAV